MSKQKTTIRTDSVWGEVEIFHNGRSKVVWHGAAREARDVGESLRDCLTFLGHKVETMEAGESY